MRESSFYLSYTVVYWANYILFTHPHAVLRGIVYMFFYFQLMLRTMHPANTWKKKLCKPIEHGLCKMRLIEAVKFKQIIVVKTIRVVFLSNSNINLLLNFNHPTAKCIKAESGSIKTLNRRHISGIDEVGLKNDFSSSRQHLCRFANVPSRLNLFSYFHN